MKKNGMLTFLMLLSTILFAQQGHVDPSQKASKEAEQMRKELALTEAQYASVKSINEKYALKAQEIRADSSAAKDESKDKFKAARSEKDSELKKVLTAEQMAKWNAIKSSKKQSKAVSKGKGGKYGEKVKSDLSLSDDQYVKFQALNKQIKDRHVEVKNNSALSDEQKKDELKKLKKEHNEKMKTILNEDQLKKWNDMKEQNKKRKSESK
jgi:hypothetical protein